MSFYPQTPSALRDRLGHQQLREKLDLDIEELEFSVRLYGRLKDAGIHTVRALVQFTEEDLLHAGFTSTMRSGTLWAQSVFSQECTSKTNVVASHGHNLQFVAPREQDKDSRQ
jgi:hypothetical protein